VDVLKKTLHRQWFDEAEMRTGVDSLLGRIAEFAPVEAEDSEGSVTAAPSVVQAELTEPIKAASTKAGAPSKQAAAAKSVRIALGRLDRMMNTVGELVINRTRMVGRVDELEKLVDTLGFSKERLQNKVSEFQEKYEYNRLSSTPTTNRWNAPS